jgi:hypothetical protein
MFDADSNGRNRLPRWKIELHAYQANKRRGRPIDGNVTCSITDWKSGCRCGKPSFNGLAARCLEHRFENPACALGASALALATEEKPESK